MGKASEMLITYRVRVICTWYNRFLCTVLPVQASLLSALILSRWGIISPVYLPTACCSLLIVTLCDRAKYSMYAACARGQWVASVLIVIFVIVLMTVAVSASSVYNSMSIISRQNHIKCESSHTTTRTTSHSEDTHPSSMPGTWYPSTASCWWAVKWTETGRD